MGEHQTLRGNAEPFSNLIYEPRLAMAARHPPHGPRPHMELLRQAMGGYDDPFEYPIEEPRSEFGFGRPQLAPQWHHEDFVEPWPEHRTLIKPRPQIDSKSSLSQKHTARKNLLGRRGLELYEENN